MRVPWVVLDAFSEQALTLADACELIPGCQPKHIKALIEVGILVPAGWADARLYRFAGAAQAAQAAD